MKLLLFAAFLALAGAAQAAVPTVDGSNGGSIYSPDSTSLSVVLTTANAGDVICLSVFLQNRASSSPSQVTGVTSTNVTGWALVSLPNGTAKLQHVFTTPECNQAFESPPCALDLELWCGTAAAPLAGETITANYTSTSHASVGAFGVSGVGNLSAPFDTNASLVAYSTPAPSATSAVFSTTLSSNLGIFLLGSAECTAGFGAQFTFTPVPPGWMPTMYSHDYGFGCTLETAGLAMSTFFQPGAIYASQQITSNVAGAADAMAFVVSFTGTAGGGGGGAIPHVWINE